MAWFLRADGSGSQRQSDITVSSVSSGSVIATLEEAGCDVLLLSDCCNAYPPAGRSSPVAGPQQNIIEVLSATESDCNAIELGPNSFSRHLDESLLLSARRGPTKVIDLNAELKSSHYWLAGASRSIILAPLSKPAETTSPPTTKSSPSTTT